MSNFHHQYVITVCPKCGADLTVKESVTIESWHDSLGSGSQLTNLDANGVLRDTHRIILDGLHAGTRCAGCDEAIDDYEGTE